MVRSSMILCQMCAHKSTVCYSLWNLQFLYFFHNFPGLFFSNMCVYQFKCTVHIQQPGSCILESILPGHTPESKCAHLLIKGRFSCTLVSISSQMCCYFTIRIKVMVNRISSRKDLLSLWPQFNTLPCLPLKASVCFKSSQPLEYCTVCTLMVSVVIVLQKKDVGV